MGEIIRKKKEPWAFFAPCAVIAINNAESAVAPFSAAIVGCGEARKSLDCNLSCNLGEKGVEPDGFRDGENGAQRGGDSTKNPGKTSVFRGESAGTCSRTRTVDLLIKRELGATDQRQNKQQLASTIESHGPQFGPHIEQNPGTNKADNATPTEQAPAAAASAPGMAVEAPQSAPDALAGVVAQLRDELAAQRQENAQLRKTIDALSLALAKLAGAGAGADKD